MLAPHLMVLLLLAGSSMSQLFRLRYVCFDCLIDCVFGIEFCEQLSTHGFSHAHIRVDPEAGVTVHITRSGLGLSFSKVFKLKYGNLMLTLLEVVKDICVHLCLLG